jgi:hypothetical protein
MKITFTKNWFAVAIAFAVLLWSGASPANAVELAYEAVDGYAENSLLGQARLGAGFDPGNWAGNNLGGGNFVDVVAGGLTYSNGGATLVTTGNQHVEQQVINGGLRGRLDLSGAGPFSAYMSTPGSSPIDQGTLYYSYLASGRDTGSWQSGTELTGDSGPVNTGTFLQVS